MFLLCLLPFPCTVQADQNHFTVLHPTKPGKMLLIPQGLMWSEVRAGDLAEVAIPDDVRNIAKEKDKTHPV